MTNTRGSGHHGMIGSTRELKYTKRYPTFSGKACSLLDCDRTVLLSEASQGPEAQNVIVRVL